MSDELTISDEFQKLAPLIPSADEQSRSTKSGSGFLPVIKLVHSVSDFCNEDAITINGEKTVNKEGSFFLTDKDINFGETVTVHVVHRRWHALMFVKNAKSAESFDPNSPVYKDIESTPTKKDRSVVTMYGDDWLFWLPDIEEFCTYFPSTNTARPVSRDIFDYITPEDEKRQVAKDLPYTRSLILSSKFENRGANFKCYVPKIEPFVGVFATLPSGRILNDALAKFLDPVKNEGKVEEVEEDDDR